MDSGRPILGTSNWVPKLGMPGNFFLVGGNKHRYFAYLSFLAYQRNVKLFYGMLDTLIKALTSFTSESVTFVDRQIDKYKD